MRGVGRTLRPHVVDELGDRHDLPGTQGDTRKQSALPSTPERDRPVRVDDVERAKEPDLHTSLLLGRRPACKGFSSVGQQPASGVCDKRPMNAARRALVLITFVAGAGVAALGAWGTAPGANGDLVFRRYFDDSHTWGAIFTTTTSGARIRQLTHPPKGVLDNVPDWSPDGRHVAFQRVDRNGCGPGCETDDIWVVTSDGKHLTRVAYDPAGKGCFSGGRGAGGICRNAPAGRLTESGSHSPASCSPRDSAPV